MSNPSWRRTWTSLVVASMLAVSAGAGTAIAPSPAAAITCSVVTPCYTLTIAMSGLGQATVTATGGISCVMDGSVPTGTCSTRLYGGTMVSLVAQPKDHSCVSTLAGDACGISVPDSFAMPKAAVNYEVGVLYENAVNVSIVKGGTGGGHVVSTFPGIDCGSTCSAYQPGSVATKVTETPDAGSVFAGWGGPCTGTAAACDFNTGSGTAIAATFNKVAASPSPTVAPTPKPSASPKPSSTPRVTPTPPGSTPTPTPGRTAGPTPAPGASTAATAVPGASESGATESPSGAVGSEAASAGPAASATAGDTGSPTAPAGATGDGGIPPLLVIGLVIVVLLVGAGGLAIGARMGRRPPA